MGAVKINGTTSGSVSLEAPASGSDVTLTLPGTTMNLGTELASKLPIAGGKILQIVRATDTTNRTTTSQTIVDASISVTITPQKADSALLLIYTARGQMSAGTFTGTGIFQITDNSNNAISGAESLLLGLEINHQSYFPIILVGYATPATTSAVTYKVRFRTQSANCTVTLANANQTGQLYAIEVSA